MASLLPGFIAFSLLAGVLHGQLSPSFYATTCPNLQTIVRSVMAQAVTQEPRMGASILRLFFHDCFVNLRLVAFYGVVTSRSSPSECWDQGCDASILLDDTANFTGEKNAAPNANSVRGYGVIDAIKTRVEAACNATVSCADIVALAARDGVYLLGGPTWAVPLGRRDARTASVYAANSNLPGPFSSLATLISMFDAKGLSAQDMTALSGAHTIGMARCGLFRSRIFNDANVNASFAAERKLTCPATGGDGNLAPLDVATPNLFDSSFYRNLVAARGLLHSDQELFNGGSQDALVRNYSVNATAFASDFSSAMVKLGYLSPLTGKNGEIRLNCRKVN
ncbi:Peroxidase [Musa troglodytarum]|uniref:Peroxidase n=1 Tax=Musa troglodytarum TaxID=320322 RepID=A0A9E7JMW2_9LILI|nr:Peroxidase [Musa troglodytarum]